MSKIYHTFDMSSISVEGSTHYTVVYGLNCRKQKDSVMGHWGVQWRTVEECFRGVVILAQGVNELWDIAEPNSTPQMHHVLLKVKP